MSRTLLAIAVATLLLGAAKEPTADELMRRVNARPRGGDAEMKVDLVLTERGTYSKHITARRRALPTGHRSEYVVHTPKHEEGIVLLVAEDQALDGLWMYFPASDHLLRVASRGLSALGSDFSCEDLKLEIPMEDYRFRILGRAEHMGSPVLQVEMVPKDALLQRELGFQRAVGWVRPDIDMIVRSDYFDSADKLFKTFQVEELREISGVWTATRTSMVNFRAKHRTDVRITDIRYRLNLSRQPLTPESLAKVSRKARGAT